MASVALVCLDTLRKDIFDTYFDWIPGRRFSNCYSPSHWTIPAHATLFTGNLPSEAGVYARSESLDCDTPVLAEQCSNEGIACRMWSANFLLRPEFDWNRGFDTYSGNWRYLDTREDVFEWDTGFERFSGDRKLVRAVKTLTQLAKTDNKIVPSLKLLYHRKYSNHDGAPQARQWVQNLEDTDAFTYLNLMEVHSPYNCPEKFRSVSHEKTSPVGETLLGGDVDQSHNFSRYKDCARYLSDQYRVIFNEIKKTHDYVITFSDHGELFGEYDARAHFYGLYPELVNVPLVISGPDIDDECVDNTVSFHDIHRTILKLFGISSESGEYLLSDSIPQRHVHSQYHGLRAAKIKNMFSEGHSESIIEQYNKPLRGVAGPGGYVYETPDGLNEYGNPEFDAESSISDAPPVKSKPIDESLDYSTGDQLKALGYA